MLMGEKVMELASPETEEQTAEEAGRVTDRRGKKLISAERGRSHALAKQQHDCGAHVFFFAGRKQRRRAQ